jgi:hypothetical protein
MLRQSRIVVPGALHHIIARGIGCCKIFNDKSPYIALSEKAIPSGFSRTALAPKRHPRLADISPT